MSLAMNIRDQISLLQRGVAASSMREPPPAAPPPQRHQGFVDPFDPAEGLTGWCVALGLPQTPVDLELIVDGLTVARARTGLHRGDVCARTGLKGDFGFRFEPEIFDRFAAHREILGDKRIAVRIAPGGLELPQNEECAQLQSIFARRDSYHDVDGASAVRERLQGRHEAAAAMLLAPYRPSETSDCGCLELIAPGANGVLWFVGWARRDHVREFAAAILDRRKFRAGVIAAAFERDDLDAGSCGFVGVMRTDWRPTPGREADFMVEGGGRLRALRAMRLAGAREALAHLERRCRPAVARLRRRQRRFRFGACSRRPGQDRRRRRCVARGFRRFHERLDL